MCVVRGVDTCGQAESISMWSGCRGTPSPTYPTTPPYSYTHSKTRPTPRAAARGILMKSHRVRDKTLNRPTPRPPLPRPPTPTLRAGRATARRTSMQQGTTAAALRGLAGAAEVGARGVHLRERRRAGFAPGFQAFSAHVLDILALLVQKCKY